MNTIWAFGTLTHSQSSWNVSYNPAFFPDVITRCLSTSGTDRTKITPKLSSSTWTWQSSLLSVWLWWSTHILMFNTGYYSCTLLNKQKLIEVSYMMNRFPHENVLSEKRKLISNTDKFEGKFADLVHLYVLFPFFVQVCKWMHVFYSMACIKYTFKQRCHNSLGSSSLLASARK